MARTSNEVGFDATLNPEKHRLPPPLTEYLPAEMRKSIRQQTSWAPRLREGAGGSQDNPDEAARTFSLDHFFRTSTALSHLAAILLLASNPAFAMNQEGHDTPWITEFPPGLLLLEASPEARPLPSPRCPVTAKMLAANVYEQIQLPRHRCSPAERGIPDVTNKD